MNDLARQIDILSRKELIQEDLVAMLEQSRVEFRKNANAAKGWGYAGVIANFTLIPLNAIVSACELKTVDTLYKVAVQQLYDHYAKSGTRLEGPAKKSLAMFKEAAVKELMRRGLKVYVPGVNILVGLTEDSLAAYQSAAMLDKGTAEQSSMDASLERSIVAAKAEILRLRQLRSGIQQPVPQVRLP